MLHVSITVSNIAGMSVYQNPRNFIKFLIYRLKISTFSQSNKKRGGGGVKKLYTYLIQLKKKRV